MPADLASVYPEHAFGGFTEVDTTVQFYARVNALIGPESVVLDVGCGRGARSDDLGDYHRQLLDLRARATAVIGIDPDPAAAANPHVTAFRPITDPARWPLDDASVDVAVADFVLEHVDGPDAFFAELARVLRPGGVFCARTPNRRGYVGTLARLIPNRLHARVVSRAQVTREEQDVFPTRYRANTRRRLRALMRAHGFEGVVLAVEGEPSYLRVSPAAFRLGAALGRLLPRGVRNGLLVFARKVA